MKKCLILFLICIVCGRQVFAQKYQPKYLREDNREFKNLTTQTTESGWIEFKKEAKLNPNTFFKDYANSLGLGQHYDFKPLKDETDKKQNRHQRFQLYYKNIPVEGIEFTLHSSIEGVLVLGHGRILEGIAIEVNDRIPEPRALEAALAAMKLGVEDFKKNSLNKPNGELIIARIADEAVASNFKLAYKFNVYSNEMFNAFSMYIDAHTGKLLKKISLIQSCRLHSHNPKAVIQSDDDPQKDLNISTAVHKPLVASTFVPNYARYLNGQSSLTFETDPNPANPAQFRLSAFNNALNTRMGNGFWENLPDVANNNGTNWQNEVNSRNAQTAHWATQRMHQYLNQALDIGRNGLNGQGLYPRVVTNLNFQNAGWYGISLNQILFGRANENNNSYAAIDQVGHEYMHGVTNHVLGGDHGLIYYGESGALNEGISDIFGTALERNVLPNGWNWLYGEDLGYSIRSLENPPVIPTNLDRGTITQPDRYFGPNWHDVNNGFDNGGVHINSGVLNKWFHTICTGQSVNANIQINAIDFNRATAIVYRALTVYLQQGSNYSDMANATIQSARDLYGNCSIEEETVQNAWSAANIGGLFFRSCGGTSNIISGCYTIKAKHSNKILQPENGNNGARIRQYDANNSAEQIVEISAADNESYFIQSKATSKAYEIPSTASGDLPVQANNFTFDNRQKWLLVRRTDGSYLMLQKLLQNRAVDVEGVSQSNGAGLMVWGGGIHEGDNQRFFLQTASCEVTPPQSSCTNVGSISYQRWENIGGGTSIQDLHNNTNNLNNNPSHTQNLTSFEAPINILDNYGVRIRGYVCPPTTGNYTFWVAGDDNSELWISPNDQPSNLSRIAYHTNWTPSLEWGWFGTQQSAPITLQAGQRYYVEALMKEGAGGDNLAVGWQLPNGALERPIPGNRLIPFSSSSGPACNFSLSPSVSNQNPSCGASITLNANCSGPDCGGIGYTWSGNGLYQTTQSATTNAPSTNGSYTYYLQATKTGCSTQDFNLVLNVSECGSGGSSNCSAESIECSGNQYEVRNYSVNASNAGTYTIKVLYRSHEGPGVIRWSVNGGSVQTMNVNQTGVNDYPEITLGTASLTAGNNTVSLSSGAGYVCFKKVCIQSGGRIGVAGEKEVENEESQTLQLYPNPTDGKVTVRYELEKGQKANLQFMNAKGQILIQKGLVGEGGWGQSQTDLSAQPDGVYMVRMETQQKTVSRKFVIAK